MARVKRKKKKTIKRKNKPKRIKKFKSNSKNYLV